MLKVVCYRYIWQEVDAADKNNLAVRFVTGTEEEHEAFMSMLKGNEKVLSAVREYQYEIDTTYLCKVESVKQNKDKE